MFCGTKFGNMRKKYYLCIEFREVQYGRKTNKNGRRL